MFVNQLVAFDPMRWAIELRKEHRDRAWREGGIPISLRKQKLCGRTVASVRDLKGNAPFSAPRWVELLVSRKGAKAERRKVAETMAAEAAGLKGRDVKAQAEASGERSPGW